MTETLNEKALPEGMQTREQMLAGLMAGPQYELNEKALPPRFIEDYAEGYDFRMDGGDYRPTEAERGMLIDFGHGLLGEFEEHRCTLPAGDYAGLVDKLRAVTGRMTQDYDGRDELMSKAATAIAALVAERDSLLKGHRILNIYGARLENRAEAAEAQVKAMGEANRPIRTGDAVYHRPSREEWVVAWADYTTGYMSACGWPESEASISDCVVLSRATDEQCEKLISELETSGRRDARRARALKGGENG